MNEALRIRLNQIFERITAEDFLAQRGIGNEIGFYVFEYPPEEEMVVRQHIRQLGNRLRSDRSEIRFASVNLFKFLIDDLQGRRFLEKCCHWQKERGDAYLLKALAGLLAPEKVAQRLATVAGPDHQHDLVLLHGVGSAYPLLRTHALLTSLHRHMDRVPVVLFFPGTYVDGNLRLFGGTNRAIYDHNYYRALRLII